jgi:3-hydroxymyristoyl/3-hydroxydecanoyl-(acyl carrier protein) dehydratase
MSIVINQEEIKQHIIHRHENILLDRIIVDELYNGEGALELNIQDQDELDRDIFLTEKQNQRVILSPIFMEIMALAAITCSGKLADDQVVFFTGISQFEKICDLPANSVCKGHVKKLSQKKGFLKYEGRLETADNQVAATGLMTAYFMDGFQEDNTDSLKRSTEFPTFSAPITIDKQRYAKQENMMLVDQLSILSDTSCLTRYTFPTDHPLNKGHFPGNPIMMGVMQWMSIADACTVFLEHTNHNGTINLNCNAIIINQDQIVIAEFKQVECKAWINVDGVINQTDIVKTNRVVFRHTVKPTDTLSIWVSDISIS